LGETGEITGKFENIEDRISTLQGEITNLIKHLGTTPKEATPSSYSPSQKGPPQKTAAVNVKCKQWEDFKNLAAGAETVSFLFKEEDNTFQANALKNGRIISYTGEFPQNTSLLKLWLSKELAVTEDEVFEGTFNIS
jgi:hypothetical protein